MRVFNRSTLQTEKFMGFDGVVPTGVTDMTSDGTETLKVFIASNLPCASANAEKGARQEEIPAGYHGTRRRRRRREQKRLG